VWRAIVLPQFGAELTHRGTHGGGEGRCGRLQSLAHLGVLERGADRSGYLVPCAEQGAERILDLLLARTIAIGHLPISVAKPLAEPAELLVKGRPGVSTFFCRRILVVRLHLLDGTYELFRSHYGRRDTVIAPDGHDVRATLGIMESTLSLLREPGVTHLAASFDTVIESFRNEMFPLYKSSAGMDEELLRQFPFAEDALEAIGVVVWRNIEFEADDALAAAAIKWVDEVAQVVICSPDKDLCQIVVGDRIVTYNRREQKILDEDGVVEKFGVHPESIPDYLALVGDTADGVPGLPGWGAKSSSAILSRFPRLELIPPDPVDWGVTVRGAAKLAESLAANQEAVYLFRELTTLRLDAPIEETLEDLQWRGVPSDQFRRFCQTMGFDADSINVHRWAD
jgi:5'-3' exonuclease